MAIFYIFLVVMKALLEQMIYIDIHLLLMNGFKLLLMKCLLLREIEFFLFNIIF